MLILVTGGLGFIGTNLVQEMIRYGIQVATLDSRALPPTPSCGRTPVALTGDIRNKHLARITVRGADAVVHLAAIPSVPACEAAPEEAYDVNVNGTVSILENAIACGIPFILASSMAVLGNQEIPTNEEQEPHPISVYGKTKLEAEKVCLEYGRGVVLRFTNVYGPCCGRKNSIIPELFRHTKGQEPMPIYGDGHQTRDLVYVGDVCRATLQVLGRACSGRLPSQLYHIGSGVETSVLDMVRAIEDITGFSIYIVNKPKRERDIDRSFTSIDRAQKELGYCPSVQLRDGIKKTWSWMQDTSFGRHQMLRQRLG